MRATGTEPSVIKQAQNSSGGGMEISEPVMVEIPEGWFEMGCATGRDDEQPVHRVWVDGFELAACQATNAEYAKFLAQTGYPQPLNWNDPKFSRPEQPVVAISWLDAMAYCRWLSKMTGRAYRLPTEAEWERASRGGVEGRLYPWGNEPPETLPDYRTRWKDAPEPVARYRPNAYGIYDISENVHEWCADWYHAAYYRHAPERNPQGPADGIRRASRGGSWRHHIKVSRCAARSSIPPDFRYADYGFRLAR